ncbi:MULTISPECIES: sensor histidine kinase [Paenibacillaceae]|nr:MULTISPECIES: ATP-binding protein [Paenibacillaceae]MEC0209868.1 ATP-binding protein [Paenibacillus ehimensis]
MKAGSARSSATCSDNAVKHTVNGSIVVTAAENRSMIEVSVKDTGEGIEAQHIPHLFEAFQLFDERAERRGFGLGLSIVKQLVELLKGTVTVSSTKGVGTTFTFTLPIAGNAGNR